jgi:hypothetical protein
VTSSSAADEVVSDDYQSYEHEHPEARLNQGKFSRGTTMDYDERLEQRLGGNESPYQGD